MSEYKLVLDEPWNFLNARGNPVEGRRLTFQLEDGTVITIDVSHNDYGNLPLVKEKLTAKIETHEALKAL